MPRSRIQILQVSLELIFDFGDLGFKVQNTLGLSSAESVGKIQSESTPESEAGDIARCLETLLALLPRKVGVNPPLVC